MRELRLGGAAAADLSRVFAVPPEVLARNGLLAAAAAAEGGADGGAGGDAGAAARP